MKKIFSHILLGVFSILSLLPISIGIFVSHHSSEHQDILCIEHCIQSLHISDETSLVTQISQEIVGKIFFAVAVSFFYVAWIFSSRYFSLYKKYRFSSRDNFYLTLIGSIKSRT